MIIDKSQFITKAADWLNSFNTTNKKLLVPMLHGEASILTAEICIKANANNTVLFGRSDPNLLAEFHFCNTTSPSAYFLSIRCEAEASNAIVVSSLNRTRGCIERRFDKYMDTADVYPILSLYHSESSPTEFYLDHELLEAIDRDNKKTNIVTSEESPHKNPEWFRYTFQQKEIVAKLHQREKATRHKSLENVPHPKREYFQHILI